MFADFLTIAKEQEEETNNLADNKKQIRIMKSEELKEYRTKVEGTIKEVELAIRVLEMDQQQLKAIDKMINEELYWRSFVM